MHSSSLLFFALLAYGALPAVAQTTTPTEPSTPAPFFRMMPTPERSPSVKDHLDPLTPKQKFSRATRNTFYPAQLLLVGMAAGISQWRDSRNGYGQGGEGYAKRFGAAAGDLIISNYMTEAVMPTVFHQDPRYYRLGEGSAMRRVRYALSRVVLTRNDAGSTAFNYSEIAGSAAAVAISNSYYPGSDQSARQSAQRLAFRIGVDAGVNVLKEFLPDLKRKFFKK